MHTNKEKIAIHSFEDLDCYKMARSFRKRISNFCKTLPKAEEYRLKDQIIRSTRSVTANIAEGYGRHHHQENLQFSRQARGSLTESLDHLNVARDEGHLSTKDYQAFREEWESVLKLLNGYINYLDRAAKAAKTAG